MRKPLVALLFIALTFGVVKSGQGETVSQALQKLKCDPGYLSVALARSGASVKDLHKPGLELSVDLTACTTPSPAEVAATQQILIADAEVTLSVGRLAAAQDDLRKALSVEKWLWRILWIVSIVLLSLIVLFAAGVRSLRRRISQLNEAAKNPVAEVKSDVEPPGVTNTDPTFKEKIDLSIPGVGEIAFVFDGTTSDSKGHLLGKYWCTKGCQTPLMIGVNQQDTPEVIRMLTNHYMLRHATTICVGGDAQTTSAGSAA